MPVAGQGRIVVWEGASLWMLEARQDMAKVQAHAHHAIQITFLLSGEYSLECQGQCWSGPVAAVRSDAGHTFGGNGAVAFLFIEPESPAGRALADRLFRHGPVAALTDAPAQAALADLRRCFENGGAETEMLNVGRRIATALASNGAKALLDPRVQGMIAYAADHLEDRLTLAAAAGCISLSPSRARHLFAAQTGLAFKSYILWLRLGRAVSLYAAGRSLTEAAHEAGFADSAHLSRTFRRTFGLAAAELRLHAGQQAGVPGLIS